MHRTRLTALLIAAATAALLAAPGAPAGAAKPPKSPMSPYAYTVTDFPYPAQSYSLTAVDPEYDTLYLLDRDQHLYLVDSTTGAVRARADGVSGNAIAVDTASHVAYVQDDPNEQLIGIGRDGSTTAVAGSKGDIVDIAVDPRTHEIYGAAPNDGTVNVVAASGGRVATIPVGGQPYDIAIDDPGRRAYVTNFANRSVSIIDLDTHAVVATVGVDAQPYTVAVDVVTHRAYVGLGPADHVAVIDGSTNRVVDTVATPLDRVTEIGIDPVTHTAYVLGDGPSVAVIDLTSKAVGTISTSQQAYEVAVNPVRHTSLVLEAMDAEDIVVQQITQHVVQRAIVTGLSSTAGGTAGGEQIIITGNYFAGATKVLFGATPATSSTVESEERIVVTVPPHEAGKVQVRVKTLRKSATSRNSRYTYTAAAG